MRLLLRPILIILGIATFMACKKESEIECDSTETITYDSHISAIISNNCKPCHFPGGSQDDYSTYEKVKTVTNNGAFEKEVLTNRSMPQGKTLSDSDLKLIKCWVDGDYPEK